MSIIELAKYRKPKPKRYEEINKNEDSYECMACGCGEFKLWPSGSVSCVGCGSKIRNLLVGQI